MVTGFAQTELPRQYDARLPLILVFLIVAISGCCYADILTIPTGFNKISSVSLIIVTKKEEFHQDSRQIVYDLCRYCTYILKDKY